METVKAFVTVPMCSLKQHMLFVSLLTEVNLQVADQLLNLPEAVTSHFTRKSS